jgi:hypothetical protein
MGTATNRRSVVHLMLAPTTRTTVTITTQPLAAIPRRTIITPETRTITPHILAVLAVPPILEIQVLLVLLWWVHELLASM